MATAERRLAELSDAERQDAWVRWAVIAPAVDDGVPLIRAAREAGVPISTARRWLARYRQDGLVGLARTSRSDRGQRRIHPELVALVEGLAVRRPRLTAASISRRVQQEAARHG